MSLTRRSAGLPIIVKLEASLLSRPTIGHRSWFEPRQRFWRQGNGHGDGTNAGLWQNGSMRSGNIMNGTYCVRFHHSSVAGCAAVRRSAGTELCCGC